MDAEKKNKTAIIAITKQGAEKARHLQRAFKESILCLPQKFAEEADSEAIPFHFPLRELLTQIFRQYRKIVLFTSAGAAVRLIAPLVKSKEEDPAVVVVDQEGKFTISLLSGHWGGANDLARKVASILGSIPVITTASELSGTLAADMIGKEFGWQIENKANIPFVSAAIVNGEKVGVYQDCGERGWLPDEEKPPNIIFYDSLNSLQQSDIEAALIINDRILDGKEGDRLLKKSLIYRPRSLVVGVGFRRGTGAEEIERALSKALEDKKLSIKSIRNLATLDIKKNDTGLGSLAKKYGWPIEFFKVEELKKATAFTPSTTVFHRIGALGVCEPAALISSGSSELLLKKTISGNVTIAIARVPSNLAGASREKPIVSGNSPFPVDSPQHIETGEPGKLYLIGLGPGSLEQMTCRARQALEDSEIIIGYKSYLDSIDSLLTGKRVISSGMGGEVKRAREAITMARAGKRVALVSGGDTGIYGMAGLVFELLHKEGEARSFECEVVPGIPALTAVASLLGAPLMGDFAAISLSDLLVPWETIAHRLERAAQGDFVLVLYNPRSQGRMKQIEKAREILLRYRTGSTPAGIVSSAYREGQQVIITDLEHMLDYQIDMNSLVIIGNSSTFTWGNRMVTPRGYSSKYNL